MRGRSEAEPWSARFRGAETGRALSLRYYTLVTNTPYRAKPGCPHKKLLALCRDGQTEGEGNLDECWAGRGTKVADA